MKFRYLIILFFFYNLTPKTTINIYVNRLAKKVFLMSLIIYLISNDKNAFFKRVILPSLIASFL